MKKFIQALARHEAAKQMVDGLTRDIGAEIEKCPITIKVNDYTLPNSERCELWDEKTSKNKTHLWHAFQTREPSSCGWGEVGICEDGVLDALSEGSEFECAHCFSAYQLILHRKEARRELGYARLSIRALGRQALKMVDADE